MNYGTRSPLLDGPVQRQILLLKLSDLMERRPDFGSAFNNDPDGEIRKWLAKAKAIIGRVSIGKSTSFDVSLRMSANYWAASMNSIQVTMLEAIEDLKLELELYQDDDLGKIFEAGQEYDFLRTLISILDQAEEEVFIVDPYFTGKIFTSLFSGETAINIRILLGKGLHEVQETGNLYARQTGKRCEVRKSRDLHDRLLILDRKDCYLVGASIKDGGRKPTYIVPLIPDQAAKKIAIYSQVWSVAIE